ncbi:MAG: family peptidase [Xanthomonadaceae bacterium]|nr:family peptidase [Xanthomonadaceae bacterium]
MSRLPRALLVGVAVLLLSTPPVLCAQTAAPQATPYPGILTLDVDATDLSHRIFRTRERIPVQPGPLTLLYPRWLPGNHSPTGPIDKIAGIRITAHDGSGNGQRIDWVRDPLDVYAFKLDVPAGVSSIEVSFDDLTPTDRSQGRVVMTPAMLNLQWNAVAVYPAGHDTNGITIVPSVKLPPHWQAATALDGMVRDGDTLRYAAVSFETLVDSPMYAGQNFRQIDLDPGARVPVRLDVFADDPKQLEADAHQIAVHRNLVQQAYRLFASHHYDHYDFLFSLSDQMSGNGLEHHRSSEDGVGTGYFTEWDSHAADRDLLPHEFTHSWNGKFRRGADLATPNFNVPMQDSLLWVYEGQTQYWGNVLAGRSGLRTAGQSRDALALVVAAYTENRAGLSWRALQDTTNDPIIAMRRPKPYRGWQLSEDYYSGGQLIWLQVDARLRGKSGGRRSLDDFARAFFGVDNGRWTVKPYTFDDVVATLNAVVADDWATFLRARLDGRAPITGGVQAAGWKVVYVDKPNDFAKAASKEGGGADFMYSLGFNIDKDGRFSEVRWDGPAFRAGVGTGMQLVAVDDREYKRDSLEDAVKAAKTGKAPITLLVKDFDRYRTIALDYHGGLRYPRLERIPGTTDWLTPIYTARK